MIPGFTQYGNSAYFRKPTFCVPHAGAYLSPCDSSNNERNTVHNIPYVKMSISMTDKPLNVVIVCLHFSCKMIYSRKLTSVP